MPNFHHGDRITAINPRTKKLDLGRVQASIDEFSSVPSPPRTKLSKLGDYLNNREYKSSSGFIIPSTTPPAKTSNSNNNNNITKQRIVWDDGRGDTDLDLWGYHHNHDDVYRVIDRRFSPGQRVIGKKGAKGRVIEVIPMISLRIIEPFHSRDYIIPDVNQDCIQPICNLFTGVMISYKSHVGQILDVQRKTTYRLQDGTKLTRLSMDSQVVKSSRPLPQTGITLKNLRSIQKLFTYPFSSSMNTGVPYPGKAEHLTRPTIEKIVNEMDSDKENNSNPVPDRLKLNKLTTMRNKNFVDVVVQDNEVTSLKVKWTGALPNYLSDHKSNKGRSGGDLLLPPTILNSSELKHVNPLLIPKSMYLDKPTGVCRCTTESEIIYDLDWASNMYKSLAMTFPDTTPSQKFDLRCIRRGGGGQHQKQALQVQQQQLQSGGQVVESSLPKDYLVTKQFVRHKYRVVWDKGNHHVDELFYGHQLEPDLRQEHNLCLGHGHSHLYVVSKEGNWMDLWDYGVVVEKLDYESVVVEWLKVDQRDGSVSNSRILKCKLMEIDKHPRFNDFHEGRIVVRSKVAGNWQSCRDFKVGTIKAVQRFSMGQILVYCATTARTLELWPHMLDLFVGFTMRELIEQKQANNNNRDKLGPIQN